MGDHGDRRFFFAYFVTGHGIGHATRVVEYSQTAVVPRASIIATEVEWLKSIKADLVVSDVVPVACQVAADAGIRSVCVTNFSYNDCGLGSNGTDRLVKLVQEMQHRDAAQCVRSNLFGAKITGGGSGGSVCVIGQNCVSSSQEIFEIQQRYNAATGYSPFIFEGSSPGTGKFGYMKLRRRTLQDVSLERV